MSYSNCVNIHGYCSSLIYYFINFTFALFFSLSSLCSTNSVTSSLLIFFFFLKCTQTQTHPHTNTSTQTNQHRDTLAQKKIQRYTNTPTYKQTHTDKQQRDRSMLDQNDRSSWVLLDRSSWVLLDWVWVLPDRSQEDLGSDQSQGDLVDACGLELGRSWSDLIWSNLIGACGSMLDRVLPNQSCGYRCL